MWIDGMYIIIYVYFNFLVYIVRVGLFLGEINFLYFFKYIIWDSFRFVNFIFSCKSYILIVFNFVKREKFVGWFKLLGGFENFSRCNLNYLKG